MILKQCDMRTFSKKCIGKKVACYGIGGEFHRIIQNYAGYEWQNSICYLVDGDTGKAGTTVLIGNTKFSVMPLAAFLEEDMEDVIIFVTCTAYAEVVEKLNKVNKLDNTCCYLFHFMFSIPEGRAIPIRQKDEMRIPPVIHYCWVGRKQMPDLYKYCIETWHKFCPAYEIKEWNETNLNIDETIYTKQAYEAEKYGFVPDYFRLKILYENGGIYLDTDVELLRSLDDLRYNEAFCGLYFPGEVNFGLGFGAVKGNAVIEYLAKRYRTMCFMKEDGTLNELGSPVYQTEDLKKLGLQYGNQLQSVKGMTIYPTEVLSPKNIYTGEVHISEYSYAVHHYDASWFDVKRMEQKTERMNRSKELQGLFVQETEQTAAPALGENNNEC